MEMIDLEQLIKPITLDKPTGCNLREELGSDTLYYNIKELRTIARSKEQNYMTGTIEKKPIEDWKEIYRLTCDILTTKSKDLEICAWFIEASLRLYSYQGLADGFKLTRQLINLYWDALYPLPDEDGLINKVAAINGLNGEGVEGTLIVPIGQVIVTDSNQSGRYELWQYRKAVELANKGAAGVKININDSMVDLVTFNKAVVDTSNNFYRTLLLGLQQAITEYDLLSNALDVLCKQDAPSSSNIKVALNQAKQDLTYITKDRLLEQNTLQEESASDNTKDPPFDQGDNILMDRKQAFQQLIKIAEYFRKAEPHSLLPFVIERAVRWGNMAIEDLYEELIQDQNVKKGLFSLVGIDKKPQ